MTGRERAASVQPRLLLRPGFGFGQRAVAGLGQLAVIGFGQLGVGTALGQLIVGVALGQRIIGVALGHRIIGVALRDRIIGVALRDRVIGVALRDRVIGVALRDRVVGIGFRQLGVGAALDPGQVRSVSLGGAAGAGIARLALDGALVLVTQSLLVNLQLAASGSVARRGNVRLAGRGLPLGRYAAFQHLALNPAGRTRKAEHRKHCQPLFVHPLLLVVPWGVRVRAKLYSSFNPGTGTELWQSSN